MFRPSLNWEFGLYEDPSENPPIAGGPSDNHLDCVGSNLVGGLHLSIPAPGRQWNIRQRHQTRRDKAVSERYAMGLFDNLEAKAGEIAEKTGLAVTDVHAIANTFRANLTSSDGNPEEAIEAAAAQHGVDTALVREIIARAGGLESEIGDIAEHSVKPGGI